MKIKFIQGAFVFMLAAMLVSCGPDDAKLQKEVATGITATSLPVTGTVQKGVVTLSGTVETEEQKAQAETAVKAIKDVKSVTNNITVVPPAPKVNPDEALTTAVQGKLSAFPTVKMAVVDGVLTLTGDVKKADLAKVMQLANESGAKQVINNMNILKK